LEPAVITVGSNPFRDRLGYWMDVVAGGQEVVVTRHGRPRLRLLPAEPPQPADELTRDGVASPSSWAA